MGKRLKVLYGRDLLNFVSDCGYTFVLQARMSVESDIDVGWDWEELKQQESFGEKRTRVMNNRRIDHNTGHLGMGSGFRY